jgi:hypothetical protein
VMNSEFRAQIRKRVQNEKLKMIRRRTTCELRLNILLILQCFSVHVGSPRGYCNLFKII